MQVEVDHLRRKAEILMSENARYKGRNRNLSRLEIDTLIAEGLKDGVGLEKEEHSAADHVAHAKRLLADMNKEKEAAGSLSYPRS